MSGEKGIHHYLLEFSAFNDIPFASAKSVGDSKLLHTGANEWQALMKVYIESVYCPKRKAFLVSGESIFLMTWQRSLRRSDLCQWWCFLSADGFLLLHLSPENFVRKAACHHLICNWIMHAGWGLSIIQSQSPENQLYMSCGQDQRIIRP